MVEYWMSISGEYLKAFLVAYNDFRKIPDLTSIKKNLLHYRLIFSEDKGIYLIYFIPKIKPDEFDRSVRLGGETSQGRSILYEIRKRDFKISKRGYMG